MNVIQAHHFNDHSDNNEAETLEHLSTFIQLFRRTVSLAEIVTILIAKQQDYSSTIEKIKLVFEQLEPLKEHYQEGSGHKPLRHITFHRFTCRLLEIVHLYNAKHKESPDIHPYSCFLLVLREIQHTIKKYQESRMLIDIIKMTQLSFLKFCISAKKGARKIGDQSERKCEQTFSQLKKAVVKLDKFHLRNQPKKKESIQEQFSSDQSEQSQKAICPTVNITSLNKIPALTKDLHDIQKRFDVFRGLDLDFNSFRSDFFMAKNNKDDFFRQFLKRNEPNRRLITTYRDDFYLFQKKKVSKENKRNKFKNIFGAKTMTHNAIIKVNTLRDIVMQDSMQQDNRRINCQTQQSQNYGSVPERAALNYRSFQAEEETASYSLVENVGKKQLRMKNVQLSLGKTRGPKIVKGTQNIFKNISKIQPICINQAYYNQLQTQSKDSLDFLHSKLRVDPRSKYKTQVSRNQKKMIDNSSLLGESQTKKQIDPINLAIKSRSTFKGKYLEINCVPKNHEIQIKRRVFQNGASLTKMGIKNGYKIENNCKVVISLH